MEESVKRKERLQAMRLEAAQNGSDDKKDQHHESSHSASGLLANPFNEHSSPSSTPQHPPRFDYYTDPLAAFSGNKRKERIINNNNNTTTTNNINDCSSGHSPNGPATGFNRARMIPPFSNQSPPVNNSPPIKFYAQQQTPFWQPNFHPGNPQTPVTPFRSSVPSYNSSHESSGPQHYSSPFEFSNSSNGSPMPISPVPRFNQIPNQDSYRPHQPHSQVQHQYQQQQQQQSGSQPRQFGGPGGRGSPLSDRWRSPAATGSPQSEPHGSASPGLTPGGRGMPWSDTRGAASPGVGSGGRGMPWSDTRGASPGVASGGRGMPWSDPRGSSGGRGSPWTNYRGRGGRGMGGSPSPNKGRGGLQGRGGRVNASARERPDLFAKKSMVEDPWKNLVPVIMISKATKETSNTVVRSIEGNRSDAQSPQSHQSGSNSLKKIKPLQVTHTFQSGPSLAESLALSLAEAMGDEACN